MTPAAPLAALPPTLHLQNILCSLGSRRVLQGLNAAPLHGGQVVAVAGPNGAGKSTLLRCIGGFVPCSATRLELNGQDLRPLKAAARAAVVRYLPQAAPGMLHLSVHDCLRVALHAPGSPVSTTAPAQIARVAQDLGLQDMLHRYIDELSGGQKQLVWLAQALLGQPLALLLDEPLAALDPNHQHHVMQLLRRLAHEQQLLVVVVLHDLNMAVRYADQVMVLQQGQVLAQGTAVEALSPEVLARAFKIAARLERCSRGNPYIIIDKLISP